MTDEKTLWQGESEFGRYEVVERQYNGRPARILYSGQRQAAQSGMALDGLPELLFDYNQRFLEIVDQVNPKKVLLIGGGALTFPTALLEHRPDVLLDVVELDRLLTEVAGDFFGFKPRSNLNLFHGDGRTFLQNATETYDLILIDAFSNLEIPGGLSSSEAVADMRDVLSDAGVIAVNIVGPYFGQAAQAVHGQLASYRSVFDDVRIYPANAADSGWQAHNLVLLARMPAAPSVEYRFAEMEKVDS